MKKLIALGAALAVALSTNAGDIRSISLLGAVSSAMASNTIQLTNLVGPAITTNVSGTVFTNLAGTKITVTTAGVGATQNLLGQADLQPFIMVPNVNSNSTYLAGSWQPTYAHFSAKIRANANSTNAVTFTLAPVPDGANAVTAAGNEWSFSFTPTVSAAIIVSTNVPIVDWPGPLNLTGCKAVRLKRVVNAATAPSSDVYISDCYLNVIVP